MHQNRKQVVFVGSTKTNILIVVILTAGVKMKINLRVISVLLTLVFLAGCATTGSAINDPNFAMPKDSQDGYIAFSVYNNIDERMQFITSKTDGDVDAEDILIKSDGKREYILRRYIPGKYRITGLNPIIGNLESDWKFAYGFRVYPRKVTYIGSFYVDVIPAKKPSLLGKMFGLPTQTIQYGDAFSKDLPVFLCRYKNIPASKYQVRLVKRYTDIFRTK